MIMMEEKEGVGREEDSTKAQDAKLRAKLSEEVGIMSHVKIYLSTKRTSLE